MGVEGGFVSGFLVVIDVLLQLLCVESAWSSGGRCMMGQHAAHWTA
jgi:hypothetical protein